MKKNQVTKGSRFDEGGVVFETLYKEGTLWFCRHPLIKGEWGYEEEFILANPVKDGQLEEKEAA